jgi:polyvinyl alcohol dehydrogenase (cytochrome)
MILELRALLLVLIPLSASISLAGGWQTIAGQNQDPVQTIELTSAQIYQEKCATCHDKPKGRIPPHSQIEKRSHEDVVQSLTTGSMKPWANGLTIAQINSLATYLTGTQAGTNGNANIGQNPCKDPGGPISLNGPLWNGWGRDLENSRYQPKPGLSAEDC